MFNKMYEIQQINKKVNKSYSLNTVIKWNINLKLYNIITQNRISLVHLHILKLFM